MTDFSKLQILNLGALTTEFNTLCSSLDDHGVIERLYDHDPRLWKTDPEHIEEITSRLGWLTLPDENDMELNNLVGEIKKEGYKYVVLLGMGGSSLSSEVARRTFGKIEGFPEFHILDNTSPEAVKAIEEKIELRHTLFIVASKSGGTTETISFFKYFHQQMRSASADAGRNFIAITDANTSLVRLAETHGFRKTFINPSDIGGRYSVLSYFGLVPMKLMGIDTDAILRSAQELRSECRTDSPSSEKSAAALGAALGLCYRHKRDKITFFLSESLADFGFWVEQLIAESTGKEGKGLIPVINEPMGNPDNYGHDRVFIHLFLEGDEHEAEEKNLQQLERAGHPVIRIQLNNKHELGSEFYKWEVAVAIASHVMAINPFDQPNVEESKENTRTILSEDKSSFNLENPKLQQGGLKLFGDDKITDNQTVQDALESFIKRSKEGDYLALLPYFPLDKNRKALLENWRAKIRNEQKIATTLLEGPRYLHSTGQLHKGGPDTGLFVIFSAKSEDLNIPNSDYTFGDLNLAQALGDFEALRSKGRRVIFIHFDEDIDLGLEKII